ncbi:hypothetical protein BBJ29_007541 [Phytophthora kernoviae]|uniref:Uncharacterized protein n=1 Tax=Phytophthora kernoviae TaxID=325452 RepID=A0A3F2REM6_9STRA|nr:hypothetical protein BBP00_00008716 [Phytophthora kernoviae]RLN58381.1 hypothetical protein BBJ29_007541 [Phytophthora kernoviae]
MVSDPKRADEQPQQDVEWASEGGSYLEITEVNETTIDVSYDHWAGCQDELHAHHLFIQWAQLQNSLANAPSLKLHVILKRKAMNIHGYSKFDIFANPVTSADNTSVLYDGISTFIEDDTQFTYILADGVAYLAENSTSDNPVQSTRCLPSSSLFNSILPALNDAVPIPSASVGDEAVDCTSGTLFKTSFGDAGFAFCVSGASGFTAFSSDMDIVVRYLANPVRISAPTLTDRSTSCAVVKSTAVTPVAVALLTGKSIPLDSSRKLKTASHMAMAASTCSCKSTPRPCIFFHGLGNQDELDELQDSPKIIPTKFGDISGHTPCCSTVKYAVLNTVDYGWTSDALQEKYCNISLSMSDTSDLTSRTIDDTIIVTHSMGGLVMAGALATGKCSFASNTSWVSLSPPMTGSMAVDYLQGYCNGQVGNLAVDLLKLIGQCPVSTSRRSTVYEKEKYSSTVRDVAYTAAQEAYRGNVTAAICSNYYVGLFSKYQMPNILAGKEIPHKSTENDGLVEFQSCAKGLDSSLFGTSYKDQFYMPELNHADTAFLAGDGFFKDSQKPVKWFECLL